MAHNTEAPTSNARMLALLQVPEHNALTAAQSRGADCAWCARALTAETAVDLPERRIRNLDGYFTTFPRGCKGCALDRAMRALLSHSAHCSRCAADHTSCETGLTLVRLVREARR